MDGLVAVIEPPFTTHHARGLQSILKTVQAVATMSYHQKLANEASFLAMSFFIKYVSCPHASHT